MRLQYEVFGKVQGVGFRMSTLSVAEQISGLTGYVRNTDTRTVEGEVQGSRELLQQFIAALERSPAGKVSRVDIKILAEVPGEGEFRALDASFYREHRRMLSNPRRCLRV